RVGREVVTLPEIEEAEFFVVSRHTRKFCSPLCKLFEQIAGFFDRIAGSNPIRPLPAIRRRSTIVEEAAQGAGDVVAIELRRDDPPADAQTLEARRVVRLVEPQRHRQLWNARSQSLCQGANAAMADESRATRE